VMWLRAGLFFFRKTSESKGSENCSSTCQTFN
jgi:hypothetical protein